jgi:F-type H+-transporting ATPase subunit epsilon
VTLHVELLMPDRSLWSGQAGMVIAKTLDGDIGIQTGHSPVFGILSPGSVVRIREVPGDDNPGDVVRAAVRDGFLSVTNDRVSILASVARLSTEVNTEAARSDLAAAAAEAGSAAEESYDYRYVRAQLLAAGEQA